jgi:hypothetical protein
MGFGPVAVDERGIEAEELRGIVDGLGPRTDQGQTLDFVVSRVRPTGNFVEVMRALQREHGLQIAIARREVGRTPREEGIPDGVLGDLGRE